MQKYALLLLSVIFYVTISHAMDEKRDCGICYKDTMTADLITWQHEYGQTAHRDCVASIAEIQEPIINLIKEHYPSNHEICIKQFNMCLQHACDFFEKGISIKEYINKFGDKALYIATNLRAVNDLTLGLVNQHKQEEIKFKMLCLHDAFESENIKNEKIDYLRRTSSLMEALNGIHDSLVQIIAVGKYLKNPAIADEK